MASEHSINIPAHHNIYDGSSQRELRIDFCTPEGGVDENTGFAMFVPGFGGHVDSNVYKKMRHTFSDRYNLVTIQCDYFGSKYMQMADQITIENPQILHDILTPDEIAKLAEGSNFLSLLSNKNVNVPVTAKMDESISEFNDMSYMQAIDIITAIEAVKVILNENNITYNSDRVIGYGHSHGSYLLHLSNCLAPHLFSFIIDNSAWIEPVYLTKRRILYQKVGEATLSVKFDYMAKSVVTNKNALRLDSLYNRVLNHAQILCFQGDDDNLIDHMEKRRIIESLDYSDFILVTEDDVDHKKFGSNQHGLHADFLELFSYSLELERPVSQHRVTEKPKYELQFEGVHIQVDYTLGLPVFYFSR